jgi:all-trans-retinol 13,14-reductase
MIDDYVSLVFAANGSAKGFWAEKANTRGAADARGGDAFRGFAAGTTYEMLRGLTDDETLIAVLTGNFGDLMCPPRTSSFAMHAMVARHYIDGASYPVGGAGRIAETIWSVIEAAGGELVTGAAVRSIDVEQGRVVGVTLEQGSIVRAPLVVSSAGVEVTYGRLIDRSVAPLPIVDGPDAVVHPSDCVTALNVGIAADNDELGLDPANIWAHRQIDHDEACDAYRAEPESNPIPFHFITVPSAKDPTWAERFPGRTTLSICSFTSWSMWARFAGRGDDPEYHALKARITDEVWETTLRYHPQLAGRIDHAELATPLSFNRFLGRTHGNFMGIRYSPDRYAQDWLRPATPIDGLFLTGQDISSDGIAGATMSAVTTTSAILDRDVLSELLGKPAADPQTLSR